MTLHTDMHLAFQRSMWRAERIGWGAMLAVLIAAASGLLGRGWLSAAAIQSPDGTLMLEYERIARSRTPTTLKLRVQGLPKDDRPLELLVLREFIDHMELAEMVPSPLSVHDAGRFVAFRLAASGAQPERIIRIELHPPEGPCRSLARG